jgi:two-component system, response regulator PdtaR
MNLEYQHETPVSHAPPIDIAEQDMTSARLRILVIEDDMLIGMLFAETLTSMGHQVCAVAVNEHDAVTAARDHQPDIMIVDAKLGQGSGITAVDDIIARAFIPHLFVTGDRPGVLELRPNAIVIEKPFHVRDLSDAIELAMTMAQTQ